MATPPPTPSSVTTWTRLLAAGHTPAGIRAQLDARRWRRWGYAIVLHRGELSRVERWHVGRIHAGTSGLLTAFTAAEACGLHGWSRPTVHVLARPGSHGSGRCPFPLHVHRVADWSSVRRHRSGPLHELPGALVVAAASLDSPRAACGLLAAAVQQRLVRTDTLIDRVSARPTLRHRGTLLPALHDIAQGAQALSEIDFARLCRRFHLPEPSRQRIRRDGTGRRRYLDAEWDLPSGRSLLVEVDGALHLEVRHWWDDQLRHNEVALRRATVLRFPSVVIRTLPEAVARQLRLAIVG